MPETYLHNGEVLDINSLVLKIQNGESELLSLISSAYSPVINKYVSSINCSDADKEDFYQIALLALCGAVNAYDFSSSSFSTFVVVCIKRAIASELRRIYSKKQIPQSSLINIDDAEIWDDNDPEAALINRESAIALTDKIKLCLSAFEYKVLNAYLKLGNYSEIAESLSISVKDVNNALQRARKKIKKSIGNVR